MKLFNVLNWNTLLFLGYERVCPNNNVSTIQWLKFTTTPQSQMKLTAGMPAVTSADKAMIADIGPGTRMIQEPTNVSP